VVRWVLAVGGFDAKQAIVAAVCEQIQQAVGTLSDVANALEKRLQHRLDVGGDVETSMR